MENLLRFSGKMVVTREEGSLLGVAEGLNVDGEGRIVAVDRLTGLFDVV